jgi:hypothetical protein
MPNGPEAMNVRCCLLLPAAAAASLPCASCRCISVSQNLSHHALLMPTPAVRACVSRAQQRAQPAACTRSTITSGEDP